jgi:hypothetical protein
MHIKNPLILDKIQAAMNLLNDLTKEIKNYQDKSLFFQDSRVIEGWLLLAGEIKEIEIEDASESNGKWEQRSEPYAASLIARRDLFQRYKDLYQAYDNPLFHLWTNYSIDGECISADAAETLKANHYEKILQVEDFDQYLEDVNSRSNDARVFTYKTLTYIHDILRAIMDNAGQTVIDLKPTDEDFAKAIDDDLRGMTNSFRNKIFEDMKEDLNRHYKAYRTAPYTPELWSELLSADEEALLKASRHELAQCDAIKQEHWGEDMKKQMDENRELMRLIYSSCRTERLFDLRNVENLQDFIDKLTVDNLTMFYEIIVRRNLIQCEMFPELKAQHEEWLKEDEKCENNLPAKGLKNHKEELNLFAPKIKLQELLKQSWFTELRTDKKYDSQWTDSFVAALMSSEYGEEIAAQWAINGARSKRKQLKGFIVGLMKDNGVLKGSYASIVAKTGINDEKRQLSTYMSRGKKQPYADWVKDYVMGNEITDKQE